MPLPFAFTRNPQEVFRAAVSFSERLFAGLLGCQVDCPREGDEVRRDRRWG